MKIAYFDCFAGISGDMTLGALVDAGVDFETLKEELGKLGVSGYELEKSQVVKRGITATQVKVHLHHHHHHGNHDHHNHGHSHGRSFTEIKHIIESSQLSDRVKTRAVSTFRRLGEAEAKIHGKDIDEIHFHEVGAIDAIVDIVGASICIEILGVEKVNSSPMPTFTGMVEMAHGMFPLPAPATTEILKGVPWRKVGVEGELVTPTGAAIITELADEFGSMPEMNIDTTGYGAGSMDFGIPNVLRVMIGDSIEEVTSHHTQSGEYHDVAILETNIDDLSPQVYEVVMERLFDAGALDVYLTPIQMKKNRPATLVTVICKHEDIDALSNIILEETSTLGIRIDARKRICLPRDFVTVETNYGPITIKVAKRGDDIINANPEYEDCKTAANKHNVPLKTVREAALIAYWTSASVNLS